MDLLVNIIHYIVPFVVLLSILVFVHEYGHFQVARWCGIHVSVFSIGFGKSLWQRTDKRGTVWKLSAIPLGGYCQFLGDDDASSSSVSEDVKKLSEEELKGAFYKQGPLKKLAVIFAGPAANYLFAILIFASMFYFIGNINYPPIIGEVMKDSPAEVAGLMADDEILTINGNKVKGFGDIRIEVELSVEEVMKLEVLRGEEKLDFNLVIKDLEVKDADGNLEKRPMIGIVSKNAVIFEKQDISIFRAFKDATLETWKVTHSTLRGLGQMITAKRESKEIGGIIRIAELSGDISKTGIISFISFMALLSINLGLLNLLPIPVLDGGHLVIYTIELIIRREVNEKIKEYLFRAGLCFILFLMLFATWNDIVRLVERWFF